MFENKYIQINLKYRTMKKFREFLKDIITEDVYQPIEFPKELVEKYKSLLNLKGDEQTAAIAALSDEQKASLTEYGNEVAQHYRIYFKPWYEYEDDNRWYEKGMREYEGQRLKFRHLIKKINNSIVGEDVNIQPEIQILPRSGNILWGWMLQPNHNNFIYHFLRNLNGEHTWNKIDRMLLEKIKEAPSKLSSLIESKTSVTLAIPLILNGSKTIVLYPNAIIDSIESDAILFHIDPRQYRTIKEKFGFNVQTTSLSLQWIKKHPDHKTIMEIEETNSTTGFELQKGDKYWYKVYGKEKGQLHQFAAHKQCVMLWEDLQEVFNTAIDWYDSEKEVKQKADNERKAYNSNLVTRGEQLYKNKGQFDKLYDQVFAKKSSERDAFLDTLSVQQLKDVQAYAYYRYINHYDIYEHEHKVAEYAEDWHYHAEKRHLENIRDKDQSIAYSAKEAIARKNT